MGRSRQWRSPIAQPPINRWCCDQRSLSPTSARNKGCCGIRFNDLLRNHVRSSIAIAGGDHRSPSLGCCCDQASLSHAMKDNYVRDQLASISASALSWLINRPDRPHRRLIHGEVSDENGTRLLFPRRAWTINSCAWPMLMMVMTLMLSWPLRSAQRLCARQAANKKTQPMWRPCLDDQDW